MKEEDTFIDKIPLKYNYATNESQNVEDMSILSPQIVSDIEGAVSEAMSCITRIQHLVSQNNHDKSFVSILCRIQEIKDSLGIMLEDISKCSKLDAQLKTDLPDEYFIKAELPDEMDIEEENKDVEQTQPPDIHLYLQKQTENTSNFTTKRKRLKTKSKKERVEQFPCSQCGEAFSSRNLLADHIKENEHKSEFTCDICYLEYYSKKRLAHHIRYKHSTSSQYKCDTCEHIFDRPRKLKNHIQEAHPEKLETRQQFICQTCGFIANSSQQYRVHQIRHGEKEHKCEYCKKAFHVQADLTVHIRVHTGEKPFQCNICGSCFKTRGHRIRHMLIHTGKREFVCSLCGKSFNQRGNLNVHIKSHMKGTLPVNLDLGTSALEKLRNDQV